MTRKRSSVVPIIRPLPHASREADAADCLAQLGTITHLAKLLAEPKHRALVTAAAGNAPYLARLMLKYPEQLTDFLTLDAHNAWDTLTHSRYALNLATADIAAVMRHLRMMKARGALTIALADIAGSWDLKQVTRALSDFAGDAVTIALRHLLLKAEQRGEIKLGNPEIPEAMTGIIILGMGKLGAYELNYSSDIDLIVLFDKETLPYTGARNAQIFMNKLATDLVQLLQERTSDGYVFRTDLRLRPDPMSTPLAVTTAAAMSYYETVGQNWERAAMIKARPIAGDLEAGAAFMRELVPFVWRKTLDFATIADIHSIKRQMNVKAGKEITLPGHNIKTGMGGIREIEFFVQTQQLVWGGRIPELRVTATLDALDQLTHYELVTPESRDRLAECYERLRIIEHRLQMRNDEQTHSLPADAENMREVAIFSGFQAVEPFQNMLLNVMHDVHRIYTESMGDSEPLAVDGNLVFTGVEADPDTLKTLERMGYLEVRRISDIIQGWHRGHRRSTRSKRSRQVLTELVPALLTALSKTANPDAAFFHFDDFIDRLPSGAQIFTMFNTRPEMLTLLASILGSAPALGDTLSNNPALLDSVLDADFFLGLPTKEELENLVIERLRYAPAFEQKMVYLRIFNNEKRFQAGVHLLKRLATPKRVGAFLSDVAEVILQCTMQEVWAEYAASMTPPPASERGAGTPPPPAGGGWEEGVILRVSPTTNTTPVESPLSPTLPRRGGGSPAMPSSTSFYTSPFTVLALGKLGGREMTFGSDLDIVFIYDDGGETASENRTHLTRLSQRFVSALTLLTREGRLYEVDTRLRPGGTDGPLAVSLTAFDAYFTSSAWTYEHMALTRARTVATNDPAFAAKVDASVRHHVLKPRDNDALLKDVTDMRERIAREFKTQNPWALKHVRGGMVDLDFIAQYLVLRYGPEDATIWHRNARAVFEAAQAHGILEESITAPLIEAKKFLSDLMSLLRLSAPGGVITDDAPIGLKRLLTKAMRMKNFTMLKTHLLSLEENVKAGYELMRDGKL